MLKLLKALTNLFNSGVFFANSSGVNAPRPPFRSISAPAFTGGS